MARTTTSKRIAANVIHWTIGKETWVCDVHPNVCPFCGRHAIVALPDPIASQQTDGTSAVCHPRLGGCNHGFK